MHIVLIEIVLVLHQNISGDMSDFIYIIVTHELLFAVGYLMQKVTLVAQQDLCLSGSNY